MTKKEIRIKGFDKNLQCRGMQFEVGKEYKINSTELELCTDKVFHYCKSLKQVNNYYSVRDNSRFCYIEVLGEEICDNEKCGSNHIKIGKEIVGAELDLMLGRINGNTGNFNSGNGNSGDYNTGYSNTGDYNTGYSNTGYSNTGNWNTGDWNTGNRNTGNWNTGDRNTGNCNTGYYNTGDSNTGYYNTGDSNTGDYNTGYSNTGDFNTCNNSSGFFCTQEPKAIIFNIESDMTVDEFKRSKYYAALISAPFVLIEHNDELLTHSYKDACAKWWEKMTPKNKKVINSMPNFDAEIFEEITGIKV